MAALWDPHLPTHVIVPNRQARADGGAVSTDWTSPYHTANGAGVIYQATPRVAAVRATFGDLSSATALPQPASGGESSAGVTVRRPRRAWEERRYDTVCAT